MLVHFVFRTVLARELLEKVEALAHICESYQVVTN